MVTRQRRPGFTLVELLVVIAIIGILIALLLLKITTCCIEIVVESLCALVPKLACFSNDWVVIHGSIPQASWRVSSDPLIRSLTAHVNFFAPVV